LFLHLEARRQVEIRDLKLARLVIAGFQGGNPKHIIPLPGDADNLPDPMTKDEKLAMAKRYGVYDKWNLKEFEDGESS